MENKIIEKQKGILIRKLSPVQRKHLESIDWLFNGPRAVGRTHLICTVAILHVLNGGDGFVIDHYPYNEASRSYTKSILFDLAGSIQLSIQIRDVRNGFIVNRTPEFILYEKEKMK